MRQNDYQHREESRTSDLRGGCGYKFLEILVAVPVMGCVAENVLHYDHRAIDDDAEIHRTERQKVRWYAFDCQSNECR